MTACERQEEKNSHYLAFDRSVLSGPSMESRTITNEVELFGRYLLLTLDSMAYWRQKEIMSEYFAP